MTEENQSMQTAIEITALSKNYGSKKVLDNINLRVNKREIMGFLGPNGAGKSTTMNIIAGYIAPSAGKVYINGIDVSDDPVEIKRKIGYLPETPPLYMDMTVLEYLSFVYALKSVKGNKNMHIKHIMDKVKIHDVRGRLIKNLSKGYQQRIGIAQALIGNPDILILDEPTVGLDPKQIMEIRNVIAEIGKEHTVILSTHIMQEVMAVCDRYTIINQGKIAAHGSMDEFSGKTNRYRLRIKGDATMACSMLNRIDGITECVVDGCFEKDTVDIILIANEDTKFREDVFNRFSELKMPILLLERNAQTIEELFMRIINGSADNDNERGLE